MSKDLNKKQLYNYNKALLGCSLSLSLTSFQSNKINNFLGCIRKVKNNKINQIIRHNNQYLNFTSFNQFKQDNPSLPNNKNPYRYIYPDQTYASSKNQGMEFIGPLTIESYNQIYKNKKHYLERVPAELYRNSIKDLIDGNNKHIADIFNKNISYINKRKALKFIKKNNQEESFLVNKSDNMFYIKDNYICFGKKFNTSYQLENQIKELNKQLNNKSDNKLCDNDKLKLNKEINKLQLKLEKDISYLGKLKITLPKENKSSKQIDFNSINSIRIKKDKNRYIVTFTYEYYNDYVPCLLRVDNGKEITTKEELALYIKELSDIKPQLALDYLQNKVLGLDRGITERLAANQAINNLNNDSNDNNKDNNKDNNLINSHCISYSEELKKLILKIKKRIKYHNKQLKRRIKDSRGYKKALLRYRKLNKKLVDVRKNENHQVSNKIINTYDYPIIAIEKLNLRGMTKKSMPKVNVNKTLENKDNIKMKLTPTQLEELVKEINEYNKENKKSLKYKDIIGNYKVIYNKNNKSAKSGLNESMLNQNHGQLAVFLEYKAIMKGKLVIEVPANYSSQECDKCGCIDSKNRIKTKFCCVRCGNKDHADINASKVIAKRVYKELLRYAEEIKKKEKITKTKVNNQSKKSKGLLENNSE